MNLEGPRIPITLLRDWADAAVASVRLRGSKAEKDTLAAEKELLARLRRAIILDVPAGDGSGTLRQVENAAKQICDEVDRQILTDIGREAKDVLRPILDIPPRPGATVKVTFNGQEMHEFVPIKGRSGVRNQNRCARCKLPREARCHDVSKSAVAKRMLHEFLPSMKHPGRCGVCKLGRKTRAHSGARKVAQAWIPRNPDDPMHKPHEFKPRADTVEKVRYCATCGLTPNAKVHLVHEAKASARRAQKRGEGFKYVENPDFLAERARRRQGYIIRSPSGMYWGKPLRRNPRFGETWARSLAEARHFKTKKEARPFAVFNRRPRPDWIIPDVRKCGCGGFVQGDSFVHAETCTRKR